MQVTAIIAAAGEGRRMSAGVPKQFMEIGGVSMLQRSIDAFHRAACITDIVVVTRVEAVDEVGRSVRPGAKTMTVVAGGETRQASVAAAFDRVPLTAEYVVVHDAARPFVTTAIIERTLRAAVESGAAIAAMPVRETVKSAVSTEAGRFVGRTIPRDEVYLAQTPQAFRRDVLAAAVELGRRGTDATDEAALVELAGRHVRLVDGDPFNLKITTESDLAFARGILGDPGTSGVRTGTGYDLHRLVDGRPLVLGGVTIPADRGALGHSDADVICHAVTDAVLGASACGDIGLRYPDTDPRWKDASSLDLLRDAMTAVHAKGFVVENVDVVVILERPRLSPYRDAIAARVAGALGVEAGRVSVKGKTNEGMDAVGRGEAIAAHAVALLRQK